MFTVNAQGQLVITVDSKPRTKAQAHRVASMIESQDYESVLTYLKSFNGRRTYNYVDRIRSSEQDALVTRGTNHFAKLYSRLTRVDINHAPHSSKQSWVGVEIECCIPFESLRLENDQRRACVQCDGDGEVRNSDDELEQCDACEGTGELLSSFDARKRLVKVFQDAKVTLTSLKNDGSIDAPTGYFGIEITVLTKHDDTTTLKKACGVLNSIGAKVNKSCGLHVHLDARHLNSTSVKKVGKRLGHALPVLFAMLPRSRRENSYCRRGVSRLRGDRYYAVNMTAFSKYRTVEVRCHSSTTDYDKIKNWVNILVAIASSETLKRDVSEINELTDFVKLPEQLVEYMTQRTCLFNNVETLSRYRDNDELTA